jgi:hypothetical protein
MGLLGDLFGAVGDVADSIGGTIMTNLGTVLGIVTEVHKQTDVIETMVSAPLREVAQQVQGGQVWRGPNAERFVETLQKDFLVNAVSAGDGLKIFGTSLDTAQKAVADADLEASGFAEELLTEADQIIGQLMQARQK